MSKIRTHYDNLKVTRNAPDIVIKAAHKALLQLHHPDKSSDKLAAERITRILNDAREVLLDPARRKQHDDWIKEQEARHQTKHQAHNAQHSGDEFHFTDEHHRNPDEAPTSKSIGKFLAFSHGIATDTETGLVWCRFALGQVWRSHHVHGDANVYAWSDILDAAQTFNRQGGFAGFSDWRVPSINELKTLLDRSQPNTGQHFIENQVFLNNPHWIWSSSVYAGYGGGSWFINFSDGMAINESQSFHRAVRLVRGQANKPL